MKEPWWDNGHLSFYFITFLFDFGFGMSEKTDLYFLLILDFQKPAGENDAD